VSVLRNLAALALLAALSGAFLAGRQQGEAAAETRALKATAVLRAKLDRAGAAMARAEAARLEAEEARDIFNRQLEAEAHADPDADRRALSARSVQRLRQR